MRDSTEVGYTDAFFETAAGGEFYNAGLFLKYLNILFDVV